MQLPMYFDCPSEKRKSPNMEPGGVVMCDSGCRGIRAGDRSARCPPWVRSDMFACGGQKCDKKEGVYISSASNIGHSQQRSHLCLSPRNKSGMDGTPCSQPHTPLLGKDQHATVFTYVNPFFFLALDDRRKEKPAADKLQFVSKFWRAYAGLLANSSRFANPQHCIGQYAI